MKNNVFLNINKPIHKNINETNNDTNNDGTRHIRIQTKKSALNKINMEAKDTVVHNIYDYVKIRTELGILTPIELVDVYGLGTYVGLVLPEHLDFEIDNEIMHGDKGDFIVFDFDQNISLVKKDNFRSFYRMSKASKEQQLLSAINLFHLDISAEQLALKETLTESARESEEDIFKVLSDQVMNGKVSKDAMKTYQKVIDAKYKDKLINYTALSPVEAKHFLSILKQNNISYALLTPLVDSIVEKDDDDELNVEKVISNNNYMVLIMTLAQAAELVHNALEKTNEDVKGIAHCVDTLTYSELVALKAQVEGQSAHIQGVTLDKIVAQMQQEVIEDNEMFGKNDVLAKDEVDIIL